MLYGTSLTHKILRWLLDFWKNWCSPVWSQTDIYPCFNRMVLKEPKGLSPFIRHALSLIKHLSPNVLTPKLHYKFQWLFECHFQEGGSWPVPHMSLPDDPVQLPSVSILWLLHGHQHAANTHLETKHHYTKHTHINRLAPELFFLILAHTVYKMWIKQEPNMLELWNKLHLKRKKQRVYSAFKIFSTYICWINI